MKRFLWLGVLFGLGLAASHVALSQTQIDTDELTLKSLNLPSDTEGLLAFFRKRLGGNNTNLFKTELQRCCFYSA